MKHYDLILIGTGQATGTILGELLDRNLSVATVERDRVGGSCVNWGCTPTKTLVASARVSHVVKTAGRFGIELADHTVEFGKVMERVNQMRIPATQGFQAWLEQATDFHHGAARFVDAHTVEVNGEQLRGEKIVIHTGARARVPRIAGLDAVPWLDNRGILDLEELPEHLLVLGGSYIGLEFAQAFRRLGTAVTVLEHNNRIVTREDEDISAVALEVLSAEGIAFELEADALSTEPLGGTASGVRLHYRQNGHDRYADGSHLLLAVGRQPNTDDLNLSAAAVQTDARGFIPVDEVGRTSVEHIYALGDVNARGAFTHTSVHDGQVFLDHLSGGTRRISDRIPIHSMFIDPPLARVGMSEAEARTTDKRVLVGSMPMSKVNRAREKDETAGLIKVLVDAETHRLLGATIFGVGGDEIIGMLAVMMQTELPYTALQNTVLPHPTVSELIPWIFNDLKELQASP